VYAGYAQVRIWQVLAAAAFAGSFIGGKRTTIDALNYNKESLVLAGEAIRPPCTVGSNATSPPSNRVALGGNEVRAELIGNTLHGSLRNTFIDPTGTIYAVSRQNLINVDVGRWKLNAEGQFCGTWNVSDHRRSRCNLVYRDAERFEFQPVDQWGLLWLSVCLVGANTTLYGIIVHTVAAVAAVPRRTITTRCESLPTNDR